MTPTCCAYGCLNKFEKGSGLGFYRFPSKKRRRTLWISALRRKNFVPNKHTRICGAHFVTGKPSRIANHPDYVPTLFKFKYSKHESKRFRKVLCDPGEAPDLDTKSEPSDDSDNQNCVSDSEPDEEIKIESLINSPSEIKIAEVQSILDDDDIYNPCTEKASFSKLKKEPSMSYTFLDIKGNVLARFVKKRIKRKPVRRRIKACPRQVDPDKVRIVIENNVARIVADE